MNDQADLVGIYKRTFSNKVIDLTKNENPLLDSIAFEERIGENFQVPVDLAFEQAFTSSANTVTPSGALYGGYIDPIAGLTDRALVTPFSIHGRMSASYVALNEAKAAGDKAIVSALTHLVKRGARSHAKRLEVQLLRGRAGIGIVESLSGSGTSRAIVITAATWAEGLWSGMVGARLDVYDGASPGWLKTAQASTITVASVVPATRTVNVTGTDGATGLDLPAAGTLLTFETATVANNALNTNEMPGLKFWARNDAALFNINASTQPLWAGNVVTNVGTPSLAKFIDALTSPSSYGLMNATCKAIIPPRCLNTLISDQAALRRYGASEKNGKNGFSMLSFNVQTGTLEMQPHAYQADGEFDIFCPDSVSRVGSTEIEFINRSNGSERIILESATSPSGEMRSLSNQTLFCNQPRHVVGATGVTY
jgi:hypothetical protein